MHLLQLYDKVFVGYQGYFGHFYLQYSWNKLNSGILICDTQSITFTIQLLSIVLQYLALVYLFSWRKINYTVQKLICSLYFLHVCTSWKKSNLPRECFTTFIWCVCVCVYDETQSYSTTLFNYCWPVSKPKHIHNKFGLQN